MRVPAGVWPKVFKALGVAGVAGVAATGVVVARDERRRRQVTPDQVRKQLRQRVADLERDGVRPGSETAEPETAEPETIEPETIEPGTTEPEALPRVPVKPRRRRGRR